MNQFGVALRKRKKLLGFLAVCAVWLTVSTTVGYFIGKDANSQGLTGVVESNVEIRPEDQRILLVYTCNGKVLFTYDVDSKDLRQPISDDLFGHQETFVHATYKYGILVLASTGLSSAFKYTSPILDSMRIIPMKERMKYFIAGIVAGSPGLYIGYLIGTGDLPSCSDEKILVELRKETFWKNLTARVALKLRKQAYLLAAKNSMPYTDRLLFINIERRIRSGGPIDSGLFTLLTEIKDKYEKLNPD